VTEAVTIESELRRATDSLARAGVPSPRVDAELLLGHILQLSRGAVQAQALMGAPLTADQALTFESFLERRVAREPLQHITGKAPFRSLELSVGPGVFVPRPETEQVVQFAIDALRAVPSEQPLGVDLGTGSGAIALAMATEVPHAQIWGIEVSPAAFVWTSQNFRDSGADNATAVLGDLADALPEFNGRLDVVISNPPYIPRDAIPRDLEVHLHDPEIALYGGVDGLDIVRQVSATALRLLHVGGLLVMEHGELQAADIAALLRADGWSAVSSQRDLVGRDRSTTAIR
jgi:release factor glutamine methyltransferase